MNTQEIYLFSGKNLIEDKKNKYYEKKRWITAAELDRIRKHQQAHASYLNRLISKSEIDPDARKVLKSMHKDVLSSIRRMGSLIYGLKK